VWAFRHPYCKWSLTYVHNMTLGVTTWDVNKNMRHSMFTEILLCLKILHPWGNHVKKQFFALISGSHGEYYLCCSSLTCGKTRFPRLYSRPNILYKFPAVRANKHYPCMSLLGALLHWQVFWMLIALSRTIEKLFAILS